MRDSYAKHVLAIAEASCLSHFVALSKWCKLG